MLVCTRWGPGGENLEGVSGERVLLLGWQEGAMAGGCVKHFSKKIGRSGEMWGP